jgi:hypothetical protein
MVQLNCLLSMLCSQMPEVSPPLPTSLGPPPKAGDDKASLSEAQAQKEDGTLKMTGTKHEQQ